MEAESFNNSWVNESGEKMVFQSEQMHPKNMIPIIDILKSQRIHEIEASFHFKRQSQFKKFQDIFAHQKELEDNQMQYQGKSKKKKAEYVSTEDFGECSKFQLCTNSPITAQIFLKAYEDNLKKLQREHSVRIYKGGKNIIIMDKTKTKNTILFSEMMALHKRLKVCPIYRSPDTWKLVESSQILQKQFQMQGVTCYFHYTKHKTLAFYSTDRTEEEIKAIIKKKLGYTLKIFDCYDRTQRYQVNRLLFGLLSKVIFKKIKQIRETYESILEVNQKSCCFVLHIKHQVFAKQPISQLENFISNLTFVSFPVRNSRNYFNQIKRISRDQPYLQLDQYNHRIFCCINHKKITKKDEVMLIFKRFWQNLNQKSKLTVHLKPHNTLKSQSNLPQKILDLIEESRLTCDDYQQIFDKKKHNIQIYLKNPYSTENKTQKQVQFANFIRKLLQIDNSIQKFTEEEMNDDFDQKSQQLSKINSIEQSSVQICKQSIYHNQQISGATIQYPKQIIYEISQCDTYMKKDRLKDLEQQLYLQENVKFRCWNLTLSKNKFEMTDKLIKNKLYLVRRIVNENNEKIQSPQIISFTMVQQNQQAFFVYFDAQKLAYIPIVFGKRLK